MRKVSYLSILIGDTLVSGPVGAFTVVTLIALLATALRPLFGLERKWNLVAIETVFGIICIVLLLARARGMYLSSWRDLAE